MNLYMVGWRAVVPRYGKPDRWGNKEVIDVETVALGRDVFVALTHPRAQEQAARRVPSMIGQPEVAIQIRYVKERKNAY